MPHCRDRQPADSGYLRFSAKFTPTEFSAYVSSESTDTLPISRGRRTFHLGCFRSCYIHLTVIHSAAVITTRSDVRIQGVVAAGGVL